MTDRIIKNKLAELMKKERYNSKTLSKVIAIDNRTLSGIKANKLKGIHYDTLLKICEFFKIEVGQFLYIGEDYGS